MREQTQSQRSDQSAFANALDERAEVSIELFLKEVSKTEEAQYCQPCGHSDPTFTVSFISTTLCRGVTEHWMKWETTLHRVEDEEGDKIDGEEEEAAPNQRVRARPTNKPSLKEREEHEATHVQKLVPVLHVKRSAHPSPRHQSKERGSIEKTQCDGLSLEQKEVC